MFCQVISKPFAQKANTIVVTKEVGPQSSVRMAKPL